MGWLRRDQDCIGLVLAWSLLLQAAILSFSSGMQIPSASQLSGLLCSTRTATPGETPVQNRHGTDCQCCVLGCHLSCAGAAVVPSLAFLLTTFATVIHKVAPCLTAASAADPVFCRSRAHPRHLFPERFFGSPLSLSAKPSSRKAGSTCGALH